MFARSLISFLANHGKASGGNGLAVTFVLLVGRDHFDLFGEFGKELIQYMPRLLDDDRSALATGDTTKQEHFADLVKVSVMGDGVTQVNTDGGIDLGSTVVARSHQFLHFDKLLWKRHINRQLDAGSRHQSGHGLLRQILGPDARVPDHSSTGASSR